MGHDDTIQLRLLGGWALTVGGRTVPVGPRQQRLLAALAVHGRRCRSFLGGLLWPECEESHALGSLRASVFAVSRRVPGIVAADGHDLDLGPGVDVDLHRLLGALGARAEGTPPGADDRWLTDPYRVQLLPGWYDDWVVAEQERLLALYVNVVEGLAQASLEHHDVYRALTLAQVVRHLDPLRESAARILIESHLAIGNEAAALQAYSGYRTSLAEELGSRPSPGLTRLIGALGRG